MLIIYIRIYGGMIMAKKYKRKHIPENSLTIIFKFESQEKLNDFMKDENYLEPLGKLVSIAQQIGDVSIDSFTNP
jgi:uncharacterized protein (DUF1330 family)